MVVGSGIVLLHNIVFPNFDTKVYNIKPAICYKTLAIKRKESLENHVKSE